MALYNDVRPQTLSQIKGQRDVVKIIKTSVAKNTLPNAALFVGTRGTGKTTIARILAKMVNCENPRDDGEPCCECNSCKSIQAGQSMDVIELDAASNNGVEDVRKIIGLLEYKTIGKMKVLILDEVHMLSTGAFNALLKVLEEPPKDVLFILCTTEAHKVPATILSRCRKFQFRSLELTEIVSKLSDICNKYKVEAEEEALKLVAKAGNGSMRDAESIFEPFLDEEKISAERVRAVLGLSSAERIVTIIRSIKAGDISLAKCSLDEAVAKGENLMCLIEDIINALLEMVAIRLGGDITETRQELAELSMDFSEQRLFELIAGCREVYETKPSNLSVAFLSMIISLICTESTVTRLEKEVEEMKQTLQNGVTVPVVVTENALTLPDEEGWEHYDEPTPFDEDVVMEKESVSKEPVVQPTQTVEQPSTPSTVDPATLAALQAAGFVVDTGASKVEEISKPNSSVAEEKPAEKIEDGISDFFGDFAALFR